MYLHFSHEKNQGLEMLLMALRVVISHPIERCQLPLFLCGVTLRRALYSLPEFSSVNKTQLSTEVNAY